MIKLSDDKELNKLCEELEQAGVVLDIVKFNIVESDSDIERVTLHQKTAVEFMKEQQRKSFNWAKKHASKDFPEEDFWKVKIYSEFPSSKRISWKELIGSRELNHLPHGLYSAFMDPPYGIISSPEEATHHFSWLLQLLLPSPSHPIEIFSWETNWANYFDAGKEWWGTYLWTILTEYGESITAIGVSTTD